MWCAGKTLAGTGRWRSALVDDLCSACYRSQIARQAQEKRRQELHRKLALLMGGERPAREFTFSRFHVDAGNRAAFERCLTFNPDRENLYLWGACGVGKTHLAYAIGRAWAEKDRSIILLKPPQLMRAVRMKDPEQEQAVLDRFVRVGVLVLDDLGIGADTPYSRQILQELLDGRNFKDRGGLVVTSKYSLDLLAVRLADDTIPSRLAGMCAVIRVSGPDGRLTPRGENQ